LAIDIAILRRQAGGVVVFNRAVAGRLIQLLADRPPYCRGDAGLRHIITGVPWRMR
jgi:hypothetical protein